MHFGNTTKNAVQVLPLNFALLALLLSFSLNYELIIYFHFGANKSVVDSARIPTSTLSKKSTLASYHRVREAIAAGYLQFNWKDRKYNPADILSKHWEFANIWPILKPLLFWKGDIHELTAKTKGSDRISAKKELFVSLTLTDKGQTNNPNVTPSSLPMKFWGWLAMVAPTAHTT